MKRYFYISVLFLLTILVSCASCYFFLSQNFSWGIGLASLAVVLFLNVSRIIHKLFRDVDYFIEAVRYRDFSKRYTRSKGFRNQFYNYFNEISDVFLSIHREKELQQQYLKKILELVDTGILAYDSETNDTLWINESLKNMLKIPHVKNIDWLKKRYHNLYLELIEIPLGESRLITIDSGNQAVKVLTNACVFNANDRTYKLIAFHNIHATLEEVEAGAWKGLLSVMTHEIMNSIAPVSSLADTLKKRMENLKQELDSGSGSSFEDIELAMETIRRRSDGLLKFAETYRNLSEKIVPQMAVVSLKEILNDIYQLMYPTLNQKGIALEVKQDYPLQTVWVDRSLIEQVLINFITNATFAVNEKENPKILLFSGITGDGNPYITVADNGRGIAPEIRDKIFIPFFTTRKNGSGIGLSLSREIVKLHKGNLQVQSKEGEGSAFTVIFNNPEEFLPDKPGN